MRFISTMLILLFVTPFAALAQNAPVAQQQRAIEFDREMREHQEWIQDRRVHQYESFEIGPGILEDRKEVLTQRFEKDKQRFLSQRELESLCSDLKKEALLGVNIIKEGRKWQCSLTNSKINVDFIP